MVSDMLKNAYFVKEKIIKSILDTKKIGEKQLETFVKELQIEANSSFYYRIKKKKKKIERKKKDSALIAACTQIYLLLQNRRK